MEKITITKHCKVCNNFSPFPAKTPQERMEQSNGMNREQTPAVSAAAFKRIPLAKALILSSIYRRESSPTGKESRFEQ